MNLAQWFEYQLQASAKGFVWAVEQLRPERYYAAPPRHPEAWPAALAQFQDVRTEQIQLLPKFSHAAWDEIRETTWGFVPLHWIVSKTYQHTCEHTHDILRMVLFWDMVGGKIPAKGE
jgi:hypothetical protein